MIGNQWDKYLDEEYEKDYFKKLLIFIDKEYKTKKIYPKYNNIFNALKYTPYNNVKVVILGQDPYHGIDQAEGLSFSVSNSIKRPPSLKNIFKEVEADLELSISDNNSLVPWAKNGVLLLNSVLTVEKGKPASHKGKGWELFTDQIIKKLNEKKEPIVFLLWGNYAKTKKYLISNKHHHIIESTHPSPFSAHNGFFGSKPFSKTNEFLVKNKIKPIIWQI